MLKVFPTTLLVLPMETPVKQEWQILSPNLMQKNPPQPTKKPFNL